MKIKIFVFFLLIIQIAKSQNYSISGYIEDLKTGERISGAYVIDSISKKGTISNNFGFYHLNTTQGKLALKATYLGYKSQVKYLELDHDTMVLFSIYPVSEIQEVIIEGSQYNRDENTPLGIKLIPIQLLTSIPALGEADLLKSIQSQPGIKGGLEGSAGIFVRGGGAGENLFLLDDVPIYNVSHLYGFFSAFNVSAVKDVELLKGNFPAQYGGRTSSVIDVRSLDGNNKIVKAEVSVGLISSRFTVQGPLFNNKTTFMISGRRSYFDLFTGPLKRSGIVDPGFPDYYFYDLNASMSHTFSRHDRIYLCFYMGKDNIQNTNNNDEIISTNEQYTESTLETSGWGNLIGSVRWNHTFGNSLFSNTTLAYSKYNYFTQEHYNSKEILDTNTVSRNYLADYSSQITDVITKTDFEYSLSNNQLLKFGAGNTFHIFNPGKDNYNENDQYLKTTTDTTFANAIIHANEPYCYIEDEIKPNTKIKINAGIRFSGFISKTESIINPEPRLSVNYSISPGLVIKTGCSRMVQYMHLLSMYNVSWPTDIWVPATNGVNPLKSDQVNIGLAFNWNKTLLISIETYYKWLYNTTDYKNGASIIAQFVPWYEQVTQGTGIAKGIELSIEKQHGRITGSINYTLSSSDRTYPDLNNGTTFPFSYDRLNDFNIFVNYKFSEKWDASAMWVYGTGYPVTIPVEQYVPDLLIGTTNSPLDGQIYYYPTLNNCRLPAYHRLDIGIHRKTRNRYGVHMWSFDIFNAYDRKNPVYMYFDGPPNNLHITYGSLLPIIPSVTYTFKWR